MSNAASASASGPRSRTRPIRALLGLSVLTLFGCLGGDVSATLAGAPSIVTQPVARTVTQGETANLFVVATGDGLVYQWYRAAVAVTGATGATLTIPSAQMSDAGVYQVAISNSVATAVSDTASLVVVVPTSIVGYTLTEGIAASTNQGYSSTAGDQSAVRVFGTADLTLINPAITKSGDASSVDASLRFGTNAAVLASGGKVHVIDGTIATSGSGASGLFATGSASRITMTRGVVATTGASSYAVGASLGATIDVARTTLRATSGTLVSATGASTVSLLVEGDSLSGSITADASSTINVVMQGGASLTGVIQGASVALDSTTTWKVTGDSAPLWVSGARFWDGTSITNIVGNGFTVSYLASRPENAVFGGRTYTLAGGGLLVPR
ncbi:MAG: hypothetical protein JWL95_2248 [Gemmatimonadetes bacterium]|nr:hypothetical protein [Gemmatimonadota bacterium]